uniref:Protein kinase domain-containing protein n=1 Tax=Moniliophthora roreri TaxID=221103 RepID=A0A0W0FRD8_MONRR
MSNKDGLVFCSRHTSNARTTRPDFSQQLALAVSGGLTKGDLFWRDHKEWLEEHGYILRSRYHPGWKPSWTGTKKAPYKCEDGPMPYKQMDARRISDGTIVVLKRVDARDPSNPELKMGPLFSTEPLASDPRNHCIPIYETLSLPNTNEEVLLVMPCLKEWYFPSFDTIGESYGILPPDFRGMGSLFVLFQIIHLLSTQGLQFIHSLHIAHNDIKYNNIMMDSSPLYDQPMHPVDRYRTYDWKRKPKPKTRTRRPVKYYYIDFDLCEKYDPAKAPGYGGDKSVPEYEYPDRMCDPFAVDVYHLGNVLRMQIVGGAPNRELPRNPAFTFMQPLIDDMTQDDPEKRPKMDQVVSQFSDIVAGMSQWQLRSPIWQDNSFRGRFVKKPLHWCRHLYNMITRVPAIPTPK